MKRLVCTFAVLMACGMLASAVAQQQASTPSLGDAARRLRANKQPVPTARVYTNENLPTQGSISTNTADNLPQGSNKAVAGSGTEAEAGASEKADKKDSAALEQEWRKKIGDQKTKVDQLKKDVDRIDREMRMQGSVVAFGDAGCLRDQKKCDDMMKAYQDELASKKQSLQAETERLDSMRDELRRAGLPTSWGD